VFFSIFLAVVIGFSALAISAYPEQARLGRVLIVLACAGGIIVFREFARQAAYAELKFQQALALDICVSVLQLSGIVLFAMQETLTASLAFAAAGIACGAGILGWLLSNWSELRFIPVGVWNDFVKNWYYGRWLFGSGLLWQLSGSFYPWIIISVHGAAEAGMLAAAHGVVAFYNPVMLALYNEAAPKISRSFADGGVDALRETIAATAKRCFLAALPLFLVFVLFGDRLVILVYGEKFAGCGVVVGLLALGALIVALGYAFPYGLLAIGKPRLDFVGNLASFLVFVILGIWAVRMYGAVGAGIGTVAASIVKALVTGTSFQMSIRAPGARPS
jgi:O-antigen/teichoic acid export membrane protein